AVGQPQRAPDGDQGGAASAEGAAHHAWPGAGADGQRLRERRHLGGAAAAKGGVHLLAETDAGPPPAAPGAARPSLAAAAADAPGRDRGDHPYARGWQQEPLRLIVRRVRIPVEELSEDPRSRRRRTVTQAQLELALEGRVEYVYAYSFILTDLEGDAAEIEHWHRQRAQIEERVKEAELGDGLLRHSGRQPGLADGPGD